MMCKTIGTSHNRQVSGYASFGCCGPNPRLSSKTSDTSQPLGETAASNMMNHNEEFAKHIGDHIKENFEVYDRFTFDFFFRNLLKEGYNHEEAKDIIIHNCALSTLVLQERIYNGYYLKISVNEIISNDLLELKNEIFNEYFKASRRVLVDSYACAENGLDLQTQRLDNNA